MDRPEPVRLPARGVNGWGLLPRYRTHDEQPARPRHDGRHRQSDHGPGAGDDEPCHHGPDENCWRDNCHAIRDRGEPGHVNRQA